MNVDIGFAIEKIPHLMSYIGVTLELSIMAMIVTLILSVTLSIIRYYKIPVLTPIINGYIDFFRGTPLVAQLFLLYYGLPQVIPVFKYVSGMTAAVVGLSLNAAAYETEAIRSALEAVPKGQTEAGLSVGMTNNQVMRYIVLPQAAKIAIPLISNDFIALIKNSSMAFMLGVRELMAEVQLVGNSAFRFFEAYLDAIILYFVICKVASIGQKKLEAYMARKGGVVK